MPWLITKLHRLLLLSEMMGMVGQGARTIVGLKKLSDLSNTAPSEAEFWLPRGAGRANLLKREMLSISGCERPKKLVFPCHRVALEKLRKCDSRI